MMKVLLVAACCFLASASPVYDDAPVAVSFLQAQEAVGGALNVSTLTVNAGANKEARIVLGDADAAFSLALMESGNFEVRHRENPAFVVTSQGDVEVYGKLKTKKNLRIGGEMNFMGVPQWLLAVHEDFNLEPVGWSNHTTSSCGNEMKKMLGGFGQFSGGETHKTYRGLPPHNQIRVKATYHFIDSWAGETAYAKLDHKVIWTDSHDQQTSKVGVQICGSPAPESKFAVPIDVVIPHMCEEGGPCSLTVHFGSTLTLPPTEQSWGVSDVQIFVR